MTGDNQKIWDLGTMSAFPSTAQILFWPQWEVNEKMCVIQLAERI
ncbi:hypothetical protein ACO0K9_12675 [Undibacterium sp. Ji50W]